MIDQMNQEHFAAEFGLTLALTVVPGMLGGITNGVSMFLKEVKAKREDWPPSGNLSNEAFFLAQALSGMGGALAALLATLWANRFPDPFFEAKAWLTLVSTGFVAGYIANRLLPAIADSLYNRLMKLDQKTVQAEEKAQAATTVAAQASEKAADAEKSASESVQLTSEVVRAYDYLNDEDFGQRMATFRHIQRLTELAQSFPANRTLNIVLARLHAEANGDFQSAIDTLIGFIGEKVKRHEDKDEDTADAYWNLSSYYEDECKKTGDAVIRGKAIEAMRQSITRVPSYYKDLLDDEDFKELRESDAGKKMLSELKPLYESWQEKRLPGA
jgi:hypothetical protein